MKRFCILLFSMFIFVSSLQGIEIYLTNSEGELIYMDVDSAETIQDIQDFAELVSQFPEEFLEGVVVEKIEPESDTLITMSPNRDFHAAMTAREQEDITYIVTTLSDQSIAKLLLYKTSLDQAGDRILHVHPLNFLSFVFSHEELKVKVRNIKSKGWVWKQFIGGLKNSLNDEYHKGNMLPEFYDVFIEKVGIDMVKIQHFTLSAKWDDFVHALIKHVASEGDNDRYKM